MRVLFAAATSIVLLLTSTYAAADNFDWTGPGWYAEVLDNAGEKGPESVGGPFADKDTCLGFLKDHYGSKLAMPASQDQNAIPELTGWCAHYPQPGSPEETADYEPPSAGGQF